MAFKEDIYRAIRDDYEIAARDGKEPFICEFMRKEKEQDIRLLIRRDWLDIIDSGKSDYPDQHMNKYRNDMLDFMEQYPEVSKRQGKKEELSALLEREDLFRAGRLITGLWDDVRKKNPYIALWEEYLDYRINVRIKETAAIKGDDGKTAAVKDAAGRTAAVKDVIGRIMTKRNVTAEDVLKKARSIYQISRRKYEIPDDTVKEILKTGDLPDSREELEEELEQIVEQLSLAILKAEARAFLYDAGFPVPPRGMKEDTEGDVWEENPAAGEKTAVRKKDRTAELIGSFCDHRGITVKGKGVYGGESGYADIGSMEFQGAAERLYMALREENKTNAYVPLHIDPVTGSGIYIIGTDYIPERLFREKGWNMAGRGRENEAARWKNISCHYCCLYGAFLNVDSDEMSLTLDCSLCRNIEEAVSEYKMIRESGAEVYREINGKAAKDTDQRFRKYFATEENII